MGKSPGRWIKVVLFGKKSLKHNASKKAEKVPNVRQVMVPARATEADLSLSSFTASLPQTGTCVNNLREKELENKDAQNLPREVSSADYGALATQIDIAEEAPYDPDKIREEMAATKAQAAFRGYLARRAFRALKGIIRLQALIRGHLVRRQALATLYRMLGIVKLQALVRGREVRQSEEGLQVRKIAIIGKPQGKLMDPGVYLSKQMAKCSAHAFVQELLSSSSNVMPLRLIYDSIEPNSASMWLERWSVSTFWRPHPQPKKLVKPQRKHHTVEAGMRKSSCSIQKTPPTITKSVTALPTSEIEKPKGNLRKLSNSFVVPPQESPQNEIEKVKRSLRKIQNPALTVHCEVEDEKPSEILEKPSIISSGDAFDYRKNSRGENMKKEVILTSSVLIDAENTPEPIKMNREIVLSLGNESADETKPSMEDNVKDETALMSNGTYEGSDRKDDSSDGNPKTSRKASPTTKPEVAENGLQRTPNLNLPSYMAATESVKAKLRMQGSPSLGQYGSEKSNLSRRHSLPSSTNSKGNSPSPRTQKGNLSGGKGGSKCNKREVPARAEWRR